MLEEKEFHVLEERVVYRAPPWIDLRVQRLEAGGRIINDYHKLVLPDFVAVVARTTDGKIILNHQYKHGVGAATYTLPGGLVDGTEAPLEAAKRELREETGFAGHDWVHLSSATVHGNLGAGQGHYFFAGGLTKVAAQDTASDLEDITISFADADRVKEMVRGGMIRLNNHIAGLGLAAMYGYI